MTAIPQTQNKTAGILWMLATMFGFIALDAVMKILLESYPAEMVIWARFFFATICAAAICGPRFKDLIVSRTPFVQIARSVLLMTTTALFAKGLTTTHLATATTIMFMSPILVTVLSIPFLGEHVGLRRWIGVAIGFVGAMIVVQPWSQDLGGVGVGALFLLAASLTNAAYQVLTRKVRGDDPLTSLLYTAAAGAVVTSAMVPSAWVWPTAPDWLMLMGLGVIGCVSHLFLIRAMRAAPASVVAPFSYSSLIWATAFGFAIWGDWPPPQTWWGAAVIIAAGLYIFHRERIVHGND